MTIIDTAGVTTNYDGYETMMNYRPKDVILQ